MIQSNFSIDTIIEINGHTLTDQGRSQLSIGNDRIMSEGRMVDGTNRRFVVADKKTWSTSWTDLFSSDDYIIDSAWGGESIWNFYLTNPQQFNLTITDGTGLAKTYVAMIKSCSYDIKQRTPNFDIWDLKLDMMEV
jgi:hypothetical protein